MYEEGELANIAQDYFQCLFASKGIGDLSHLLIGIDNCISEEVNQKLCSPFSAEEIGSALGEMRPTKASGDNGFLALFFQKCWDIVANKISKFCLNILNDDVDFDSLNFTNVVLIPRCDHPGTMVKFKLISLCNVWCKVVSKTIVNLFEGALDLCIDGFQSAFILERLISDNVFFRHERFGKKGRDDS